MSRTGSAKHKKFRAGAIREAQANGQTHCPLCGTLLDYERAKTPASAEADHKQAHTLGGTDSLDNARVICRRCNGRLGGLVGAQKRWSKTKAPRNPTITGRLETSQDW